MQRIFSLGTTPSWEVINHAVQDARSTEVIFFPYMYGSHGDPAATGTLVGIQSDTTAGQVIRGIYEGITFQLREHAQPILEILPGIEHLRLAGGIKRSRPWVQLVADTFNLPLSVSPAEEIGALGAVIAGAVGTGMYPDYPAAIAAMTHFSDPVLPDARAHEDLDRRYRRFLEVRTALGSVWEAARG